MGILGNIEDGFMSMSDIGANVDTCVDIPER